MMEENSNVELVIKIPREKYLYAKAIVEGEKEKNPVVLAIGNGILLPKGHGRIVDIGPYEGKVIASCKYCGVNKLIEVAELDTIIEADKKNCNSDGWCNTCEHKNTGDPECDDCGKYDEYGNTIALTNYKAEEQN